MSPAPRRANISHTRNVTKGSKERISRTMPRTRPEEVHYLPTHVVDDVRNTHYELVAGQSGSYGQHVDAPWSSDNSFLAGAGPQCSSDAMSNCYDSYAVSTVSMMPPTLMTSGHLNDYDMLASSAISGNTSMDGNYAQVLYGNGQIDTGLIDDAPLAANFGLYNSPMDVQASMPFGNHWPNRCPTPPPEEYLNSLMIQESHSSCVDDSLSGPPDIFMEADTECEFVGVSKLQAYRGPVAGSNKQRPIRSASEKKDNQYGSSHHTSKLKDDGPEKVKARSDPLYDRKPDKHGYYHCPMKESTNCSHQPVKQKCIYAKNLDSHLRPYKCKFKSTDSKNECSDLRFSSNACLFRHEREAHGLHNHGVNPYLCEFPDCERARPDMGFPRRWNQRDHMKRVHDYEPDEVLPGSSTNHSISLEPKRRKTSLPAATSMRRSPSGHAKTQMSQISMDEAIRQAARQSSHLAYRTVPRTYSHVPYSIPMAQVRMSRPYEVQYANYLSLTAH